MSTGPAPLPEPMEYVDIESGDSIQLLVDRYQQGVATIHPTRITNRHRRIYMSQQGLTDAPAMDMPISIEVPVLRVFGERLDKPSPAKYWDFSAKTLQADLLPRLIAAAGGVLRITISAIGAGPTKRFSVEQ